MKHIKAISCLLLSSMVLTAFCGCDGLKRGAIDAKNDILSENAPAGNTADAFFRSFICFEVCLSLREKDAGKQ